MRHLLTAAVIALSSLPAYAQDTAAANETFPVGGVNTSEVPREFVREVHGDWEIRCAGGEEANNCFLYQLLLNNEGTPIAELSLVKLPVGSEAVAGATVVAPLGTLLTRGVNFSIDGAASTQYPFSWCTAPGCFSRFGLTDLTVEGMKTGGEITISLFSIANAQTPIQVNASLSGFTAAFEAMENQP